MNDIASSLLVQRIICCCFDQHVGLDLSISAAREMNNMSQVRSYPKLALSDQVNGGWICFSRVKMRSSASESSLHLCHKIIHLTIGILILAEAARSYLIVYFVFSNDISNYDIFLET